MYGDRRPFLTGLVTLDPEEIVPWAEQNDIGTTNIGELAKNEKVRAMIQEVIDEVNSKYAQVEQVKKFTILDHDFTQEEGELTPTLKLKRNVVYGKYEDVFDAMYNGKG